MSSRKKIVGVGRIKISDRLSINGDLLECGHVEFFAEDRNGHMIYTRQFRFCTACLKADEKPVPPFNVRCYNYRHGRRGSCNNERAAGEMYCPACKERGK